MNKKQIIYILIIIAVVYYFSKHKAKKPGGNGSLYRSVLLSSTNKQQEIDAINTMSELEAQTLYLILQAKDNNETPTSDLMAKGAAIARKYGYKI